MEYGNAAGQQGAQTYAPRTTAPSPASLSLLGDVNQQINSAFGRVLALSGQVQTIADSIFGTQPRESSGKTATGAQHTAPARADSIRNDLSALHFALSALEQEVGRLVSLT